MKRKRLFFHKGEDDRSYFYKEIKGKEAKYTYVPTESNGKKRFILASSHFFLSTPHISFIVLWNTFCEQLLIYKRNCNGI